MSMSVGQLLHASDRHLRDVIPKLSIEQRTKLAHLATLGVQRERKRIEEYERVLLALTREGA